MIDGNKRKVNNNGPDYYPTPFWATEALIQYEKFDGDILEPCAGEGYISKCLQQNGYNVKSSDLYDYEYGEVKDAFDLDKADNIITNPPYNIADKMLTHFLNITENKIALLLRLSFLESKKRYPLFQEYPPKKVYIFSERLTMSPKNVIINGGGTISYGWFIWDKKHNGPTQLEWIKPSFKRKGLI